jgi:polysaccharide pyruvyl transferase CsaB
MKKIVICGNYGATNLGDEAILDGILAILKNVSKDLSIVVLSVNPENVHVDHNVKSHNIFPSGVRSFFKNLFSGTVWDTLKSIKEADVFILGGGGLFTDEKLQAVLIWYIQSKVALFYKKPLLHIGQSIGPLRTFIGRNLTKRVFNKASLTIVRDDYSKNLLSQLGVLSNVHSLADCAYMLPSPESARETENPFIVISVRPWFREDVSKYKMISSFIDYIYKKYRFRTILVPFQITVDNDYLVLKRIYDLVEDKNATEIYTFTTNYKSVIELISKATATVGMRLHSLIFSSIARTPFIAISYSTKVTEFVKQMNMSDYLINWDNLDFADLTARFDALILHYDAAAATVQERTLIQRHKVRSYIDLIADRIK